MLIPLVSMCVAFCSSAGISSARVVVVHPGIKVDNVSLAALTEIFKANRQHWNGETRVYLALPKSKSTDHEFLLDRIYRMSDRDLARHWIQQIYRNKITERPKQFPSTAVILKVLARKQGSIAIINAGDLPDDHELKILKVDGKLAGQEGYPLNGNAPSKGYADGPIQMFPGLVDTSLAVYSDGQDSDVQERLEKLEELFAERELEDLLESDGPNDFLSGPYLTLRGFGHVQFSVDDVDSRPSGVDDRFALGGLDLFLTARLSENASFLNETVFEPTSEGDYVLDVERVIFKYEFSDSLNVQAGRFHTTIGRWNELYHHGEYLQVSAGRPAILNFEDENGLLPVHMIGIGLKGSQTMGGSVFDYSIELGNGRGPTPDPPQLVVDANDNKALNLALSVRPHMLPSVRIGGSLYKDNIPKNTDPTDAPIHGTIRETIANLFVEYEWSEWRVLAELFDIQHEATVDTSSTGWFLEMSRRIEDWTPYVRLDGTHLDDQDLYFASVDDVQTITAGLRYDVTDWTALRLQYAHSEFDLALGGNDTEDSLLLQVAFAF